MQAARAVILFIVPCADLPKKAICLLKPAIAAAFVAATPLAALSGDNSKSIVLDLMQPLAA